MLDNMTQIRLFDKWQYHIEFVALYIILYFMFTNGTIILIVYIENIKM